MDNQKTGQFIRTLRISKNMNQMQLAAHLKITNKAVSKWERGYGYPDISLLPKLAEVLGVSVEEIILGEYQKQMEKQEDSQCIPDEIINKKMDGFNFQSYLKVIVPLAITISLVFVVVTLISVITVSSTDGFNAALEIVMSLASALGIIIFCLGTIFLMIRFIWSIMSKLNK